MSVKTGKLESSAPAVRRKRHRPEVRRALILEAAREFIAERGLAAVTAREVAARCGISTGTLTHYFASMDELLVETLRTSSKQFTEALVGGLRAHESASARLDHLIDAALPATADALIQFRLWLEYWSRAAHDPQLAGVHRERYRVWRGAIAGVLAEGVATGEFRKVEANEAAREIVALFDGLSLQAVIGDEEVNFREARRLLRRHIERNLTP